MVVTSEPSANAVHPRDRISAKTRSREKSFFMFLISSYNVFMVVRHLSAREV
jgi:hypothetical protein